MTPRIERKPLEFYLNLRYPITVIPDITGGFVATIQDLPGCITQGETLEETHCNMEEAKQLWMESMYEDGNEIPLPNQEEEYSGKFNVRLPKSLHKKLDGLAVHEGVSLNQYLVSTLSHAVGFEEGAKTKTRKRKQK